MIAALPMYHFDQTRIAHAALWDLVRDHLRDSAIAAPQSLSTDLSPHDAWSAPDLVLSHICNLPFRQSYRDRLTPIGASDYGLEGCGPGQYRSLFVVRDDHPAQRPEDLAGTDMAYNAADSHSGWGSPAAWAMARDIRFNPALQTGSHQSSVRAVAAGAAAFASIDAQSFVLLQRFEPAAKALRLVGTTPPSPGMTFVTARDNDPIPFRTALQAGIEGLNAHHRALLGLRGIVELPQTDYDIPLPPSPEDWRA